jgi:hypothetical protein
MGSGSKTHGRFNEQTGKRSIRISRMPPMNDPRTLRIQVADEYRVITRAKLGNHPNRNFANLIGENEEGLVAVCDDLNGNWRGGQSRSNASKCPRRL